MPNADVDSKEKNLFTIHNPRDRRAELRTTGIAIMKDDTDTVVLKPLKSRGVHITTMRLLALTINVPPHNKFLKAHVSGIEHNWEVKLVPKDKFTVPAYLSEHLNDVITLIKPEEQNA